MQEEFVLFEAFFLKHAVLEDLMTVNICYHVPPCLELDFIIVITTKYVCCIYDMYTMLIFLEWYMYTIPILHLARKCTNS